MLLHSSATELIEQKKRDGDTGKEVDEENESWDKCRLKGS